MEQNELETKKRKVLIIDDNQDDSVMIKDTLERIGTGIDFSLATTGEIGIEKVKDFQPHIIIIDTKLPGIDGFQTCRRIRELEGLNAKIIVVTGQVDLVNPGKARLMGADEYCVKTTDCQALIDVIKEFLDVKGI